MTVNMGAARTEGGGGGGGVLGFWGGTAWACAVGVRGRGGGGGGGGAVACSGRWGGIAALGLLSKGASEALQECHVCSE